MIHCSGKAVAPATGYPIAWIFLCTGFRRVYLHGMDCSATGMQHEGLAQTLSRFQLDTYGADKMRVQAAYEFMLFRCAEVKMEQYHLYQLREG